MRFLFSKVKYFLKIFRQKKRPPKKPFLKVYYFFSAGLAGAAGAGAEAAGLAASFFGSSFLAGALANAVAAKRVATNVTIDFI